MIDLIIPTMWKFDLFPKFLSKYIDYSKINKIIIIDNDYKDRPKDIPLSSKIIFYKPLFNIFVGPSWNIGVDLSESDTICILNDDVFLSNDVIDYVLDQDFSNIDIIGNNILESKSEINLEKINVDKKVPLGNQYYNFGTCMFMKKKKYSRIPSLYKCWFTDDYIVSKLNNIYRISMYFEEYGKYKSSNTIKRIEGVNDRIELDMKNAKKYLFGN